MFAAFSYINITKGMLQMQGKPAAYFAYQVAYQLPCTSVHLKLITSRQDICFHKQSELYLARKLRSITEVNADDTLNLIRGLAILQDVRTLNSPNRCEVYPPRKSV